VFPGALQRHIQWLSVQKYVYLFTCIYWYLNDQRNFSPSTIIARKRQQFSVWWRKEIRRRQRIRFEEQVKELGAEQEPKQLFTCSG